MPIQRNQLGYITNAGELTHQELSGEHVLCPACDAQFNKWSLGWDGHAQKCPGLKAATHEERKKEFRTRFARLLRAKAG